MPVLAPDDLRVTFKCRDCQDAGYIFHRCEIGDGPQTRDLTMQRRRCDRGQEHQTHTYVVPCGCRPAHVPYPEAAPEMQPKQRRRERWSR